jgi:phosphatidate phosphatase
MPNDTTCRDEVNQHRYIQEFTCTNSLATDHMLKNMRLSFPSGHSSFAFVVGVFIVIYIQARITWRGSTLFKHFLQLLFITAATYTALSRISDYKHHWSDVFGGFILGTGIAIVFAYCATDFFKIKPQHRMTRRESNNGVSNHQV